MAVLLNAALLRVDYVHQISKYGWIAEITHMVI